MRCPAGHVPHGDPPFLFHPPRPTLTPWLPGCVCVQTGVYDLPLTREENRAEILTSPDQVNLGPLGRPAIVSIALPALSTRIGAQVPAVTFGR